MEKFNPEGMVKLIVENQLSFERKGEPISSGIPVPSDKGIVKTDCFAVYDEKGKRLSAQFLPLAWWRDGKSIKWVLMNFKADVPSGGAACYYLDMNNSISALDVKQLASSVDSRDVLVDTDALKFKISKDSSDIIRDIQLKVNGLWKKAGQADSGYRLRVVDNSGNILIPGAPQDITIEDNGPERAVIKITGSYKGQNEDAGLPVLSYIIRVTAYRNDSHLKFEHTLINLQGKASLNELCLQLDTGKAEYSINQGYEDTIKYDLQVSDAGAASGILHDDENKYVIGQLDKIEGLHEIKGRFNGWISAVTGEGWALSATTADFWQKYPKSLEVESGSLKVGLLPAVSKNRDSFMPAGQVMDCYELEEGESRTHDIFLYYHPVDENVNNIGKIVAAFNKPMLPLAPWNWYTSSGVFGDISPRDAELYHEFEGTVDSTFKAVLERREALELYGDRNYGDDQMTRPGLWNNCEYDYPHVGMLQFLRGAGREWYDLYTVPAATHMLSIDAARAGKDAGRIHPHSIRHNSTPAKLGSHSWLQGLTEYYAFSGDFKARDVIISSADRWSSDILGKVSGEATERATTWPVISMLAVYSIFPEQKYMDAAKCQIGKVVTVHDFSDGHFGGNMERLNTPPSNWSTFLIGSPLLESLVMYYQMTGDVIVKDVIVSTAKRLARINWLEQSQTWEYTMSTVPIGSTNPKTDRMISPGVGYAYLYSGDEDLWHKASTAFRKTWSMPVEDGKIMAQSFRFGVRMLTLLDRVK